MSQMICPKGRDGVCVGGPLNGKPCDSAKKHTRDSSCVGGFAGIEPCPDCIPVAQSGTPTPRNVEQLERDIEKGRQEELAHWQRECGKADVRACKLETELAAAREELAAIKRVTEEKPVEVKELVWKNGILDLTVSHPLSVLLVNEMASLFKSMGAENYVDITLNHRELGPLVLRIQRANGKTPGQVNCELKADLAASQSARKELAGALKRVMSMSGYDVRCQCDGCKAARAALAKEESK